MRKTSHPAARRSGLSPEQVDRIIARLGGPEAALKYSEEYDPNYAGTINLLVEDHSKGQLHCSLVGPCRNGQEWIRRFETKSIHLPLYVKDFLNSRDFSSTYYGLPTKVVILKGSGFSDFERTLDAVIDRAYRLDLAHPEVELALMIRDSFSGPIIKGFDLDRIITMHHPVSFIPQRAGSARQVLSRGELAYLGTDSDHRGDCIDAYPVGNPATTLNVRSGFAFVAKKMEATAPELHRRD